MRQREWRSSGKSRTGAIVFLLVLVAIGIGLIFAGQGHPNDNSAPTCDGKTMSTSDICDEYTNGALTSSSSYQDLLDQQHNGQPGEIVFGGVLIGVAVLLSIPLLRAYSPSRPWGKPIGFLCPQCGGPNLREASMSRSTTKGRTKTTYRGVVTLCSPACGFSAVRRPDPVAKKNRR
ncbi:hypothetical protein OG455_11840 [Kitasatospora sp. NBC_01287]|uniref:hypothetical protein n=1 Tax=Kitasatospora sp. NBC_01287 TaxID=2903573 RepID=UPI002257098D|nr:hypothetical protein [Kitasatospora sp. NBC_01287]MCX4746207.1 hypothetical protein [Kitasatospora sp. NBC_01287]